MPGYDEAIGYDAAVGYDSPGGASVGSPGVLARRPTGLVIEIEFTPGVWTDVTAWVELRRGAIERRVGRSSPVDSIQAGTLSLRLDNSDARFTPDSPLSPYWPNVVEGKRIRWRVTRGATWQRFLGRIQSWQVEYPGDDPTNSLVAVTATDALGALAGVTVDSWISATTLGLDPWGYWPLSTSRSRGRRSPDASGNNRAPMGWSAPGAGLVSVDDLPTTEDTTRVYQAEAGPVTASSAFVPQSIPITPNGVTWAGYVYHPGTPAALDVIALLGDAGGVQVDFSGFFYASNGYGDVLSTPARVPTRDWYHLAFVVDTPASTMRLYRDGQLMGSAALTLPAGLSATLGLGTGGARFAHVAVWSRALTPAEVALAATATSGVSTVAGLLSAVSLWQTGAGAISLESGFGPQRAAAFDASGINAAEVAARIVAGDGGLLWDDGTGLRARAKSALRQTIPAVSFDVQGDLDGGPSLTREATDQASVVTANGSDEQVVYTDTELRARIGAATTSVDTALVDENDLFAVASNRVARTREGRLRPAAISVNLFHSEADLYAAVLGLRLGDRGSLYNLPAAALGREYIDGYVEGWTERFDLDGYTFTLDLSPADFPADAVVEETTGVLDRVSSGGTLTLAAALGATGGTVQIAWSTGLGLTTDPADYPLTLDVHGEVVRASSPPSGSTSPQTLTGVTRGIGTPARAHAAGEPVDVYLTPGIAP